MSHAQHWHARPYNHTTIQTHAGHRHQTANFCRGLEVPSTFPSTQTQRHPDMDTLETSLFCPLNLAFVQRSPSRCFPVVHCASCQTQGHKSSSEPTRTQAHRRALAHAQKPSTETQIPADQQCPQLAAGGGRRDPGAVDSQAPLRQTPKQPALGCNSLEGRTRVAVSTSV